MVEERKIKIAAVLYTHGIEYDDRLRKEILTIKESNPEVEFKIFALEPKNREENGISSYGVPYRIPYLKSREKYHSSSRTLIKAYDFYKTIKKELKEFDAIWCADIETFIFIMLIRNKPIIWDLHELPEPFIKRTSMKYLFWYLEHKCTVIIHANEPRLKILKEMRMVKSPDKHFILRNYPQFNEIDIEYDDKYKSFIKWLGEAKCVYLQGLTGKNRAAIESISAVMTIPELKAVVVGKFDENLKKQLQETFSNQKLENRIFFCGPIKQLKTPQYIKRCFMSLIFYKNISLNNYYCEPNRLFQNIINGNPVVVGNNPPMKELVEKYDIGISIDNDGSDINKIVEGINKVIDNYSYYKTNIFCNSRQWLWNTQSKNIDKIMENIIKCLK